MFDRRFDDSDARALLRTPLPAWLADELGNVSGKGVRVGVIDSGWSRQISHRSVESGLVIQHNTRSKDAIVQHDVVGDVAGHGTACTELLLRLAPNALVLPINVFSETLVSSARTVVRGIEAAVTCGVRVLNLSLGTTSASVARSLYRCTRDATDAGAIVVAALPATDTPTFPAEFEHVIAVGKGPYRDAFAFGYDARSRPECRAHGGPQWILGLHGRYQPSRGGASLAAARMSAIIALLVESEPNATTDNVRKRLARYSSSAS